MRLLEECKYKSAWQTKLKTVFKRPKLGSKVVVIEAQHMCMQMRGIQNKIL
jgi:GTP cyclohydrolase I